MAEMLVNGLVCEEYLVLNQDPDSDVDGGCVVMCTWRLHINRANVYFKVDIFPSHEAWKRILRNSLPENARQ